jgi:hypothetical protein
VFSKLINVAEGLHLLRDARHDEQAYRGKRKQLFTFSLPSAQRGLSAVLVERVQQIAKVAYTDNPALFRYNVYQVQDLLSKLDYEDLTDTELCVIADELEAAYTRKAADMPQFIAPRLVVEYGLAHLDYEDLTHPELVAIALALAEAYGRKLLGSPAPTLRLISQLAHRSAAG